MNIRKLNEKVTIQKNCLLTDDVGNHRNTWSDFFTCHATVGGEQAAEKENAGLTVDDAGMTVTVRYCRQTAELNALQYRVLFRGEIYNITNVNHLNFRKKALKINCVKVRR